MRGSIYNDKIIIGEHIVKLPPLTKNKEDVLFVDEKDAYWRRELLVDQFKKIWWEFIPHHTKLYQAATLYDQDNVLTSLNKEDSDYIMRTYEIELRRRDEGVFIKNGDEILWLPGDYWFTLMYCKTKRPDKKGDYFDFRFFQLEDSYLVWHTDNNPNIGGLITTKPKKTGITNIRWLYILNRATKTKNSNYGGMNIDLDKAAKTFRDHFMYAYNGLPMVWKAQIKTKSETEGKITFGQQYNKSKKSRILNDTDDELNTTVMCVPTMAHAFDVDVFEINWYDEFPKYKTDFGELYRTNEEGTALQDILVGKKWFTSYTPDGNSPSLVSAKKLAYDSELRTINPDIDANKTRSGLIWHHIPGYQAWTSSFNKYGKCDEQDAMKKIQAKRDTLKNSPRELQTETRRYANNKREAWTTGGSGSIFDIARLSEILLGIEEEQRNSIDTPYLEGKLEWTIPLWEMGLYNKRPKGQFCPVKFVPLTKEEKKRGDEGRLRIYNDIPESKKNSILKNGRDEWGCIIPPDIFTSFLGGDPTQHAAASEVIEGSKNAYTCTSAVDHTLDTIMRTVASGILTFEYFERPELPDEAYEDLVKLIIYTGSLCTVEANVPEMATRLMEEGLGRFMIVKDKFGMYKIWERWMGLPHEEEKEYHLIRTTANNQQARDMLELFVKLIKQFIQIPSAGDKDYGITLKSERLVDQLMNIDITDTKKFDLFMSWGYSLFTREQYSAILMSLASQRQEGLSVQQVLRALSRA